MKNLTVRHGPWRALSVRLSPGVLIAVLILGTLALRLAFAGAMGFGIDESYMVAASRVLKLGYYDHPPIAWWIAWAARYVTGTDAELAERLPFMLLFSLSTYLMYRFAAALFSERAGLWAATMMNFSPVLGITSASWVLPDGPLIAALLGAALCLTKALEATGRRAWIYWLATGLCAGLGLLSKFSAALVIAGAVIYLLTQPTHRRWLARPHPYVAGLLALILFAPVIWWNALHGWDSIGFQGSRLGAGHVRLWRPLTVLMGTAAFLGLWIWAPLIYGLVRALWDGTRSWRGWLPCCLGLPAILLFPIVSVWSPRPVLFHWSVPGYLMLFPLLGAQAQAWASRALRKTFLWALASGALACLGATLVASETAFNWLPSVGEHFALGADPDTGALDWRALAAHLRRNRIPAGSPIPIAAINWHDAGKIAYALGPDYAVICLNADGREISAQRPPREYIGKDIVIVIPDGKRDRNLRYVTSLFQRVDALPSLTLEHAGRPALRLDMMLGHDLRSWPPRRQSVMTEGGIAAGLNHALK